MRVSSLLVWGRTPPSVRPGIARRRAPMLYAGLGPTSRSCPSSSPSPLSRRRLHPDSPSQPIGQTRCVTGKVFAVKVGTKGVHFLDFCEDAMACPFTVVVFSNDLKDVGDVRRLAGRTIEIRGALKAYDRRPEIILSRISQIEGGVAMIPPLPKNYDVENRGHFSAGRSRPTKKPTKAKAKPSTTVTFGNDVEGDDGR
ncbi:MAG TPA: hypothetical protein VNX87_23080 [Candidatus Sulfotelmatobacter sp.]|nr:hypothetical protein [Candidatus Sulfotelmatobacter sp.]